MLIMLWNPGSSYIGMNHLNISEYAFPALERVEKPAPRLADDLDKLHLLAEHSPRKCDFKRKGLEAWQADVGKHVEH